MCCYSVQNLLSSTGFSQNIKTEIHSTVSLPVVLYGCDTCSLTLTEERRLRVFENRVLRRIFWTKEGQGSKGVKENHITRRLSFSQRVSYIYIYRTGIPLNLNQNTLYI